MLMRCRLDCYYRFALTLLLRSESALAPRDSVEVADLDEKAGADCGASFMGLSEEALWRGLGRSLIYLKMVALRVVARRADLRLLLLRLLGLLLLGLHFRGLLLRGLQLPHGAHTQVKRRMSAVLLHYMPIANAT